MGFTDLLSDVGLTGMLVRRSDISYRPLTSWQRWNTGSPLAATSQGEFVLDLAGLPPSILPYYMMRNIWSVLMRRLKTPPND